MNRLAPLSEEPIINEEEEERKKSKNYCSKKGQSWRKWVKSVVFSKKSEDLKILLSVLGCPLFPVCVVAREAVIEIQVQVWSSAQYIIEQFRAATGCRKLEGRVKNVFATGKVKMAMGDDHDSCAVSQKGCFVMWQMHPNKWLIELVVGGNKVIAGCDGTVAWRHTPWLTAHAAKGSLRPLRRALEGLDPIAVSAVFSTSQYIGEKQISGIDCFVLKLSANQTDLSQRSDSTAEMIKHVIFGYFSQRSGLLVFLEDSYLTRIQSPGTRPTYWETSMSTKIDDYRTVEGVLIAHAGQSTVIITRFGDNLKAVTRMEEIWSIDDIAFNVPGLSIDCFIPPNEIQKDLPQPDQNLHRRSPLH